MNAPLDSTDSLAARLSGVLHAINTRTMPARPGQAGPAEAAGASAEVDEALSRIARLLPPAIGVRAERWDDLDAISTRLLLEELARATRGLRYLATLSRTHLASAALTLRTVEKGCRRLAERR